MDPSADGLLIVAIGRVATRELSVFGQLPKCYRATGILGVLTDSLDAEGAVMRTADPAHISRQQIVDAITSFGSEYLQVPPVYAAVKYQGMPLYQQARSKLASLEELQQIAAQKARLVQLYRLQLEDYKNPEFTVDMCVSCGTYVRSVLNDIAHKLGNYATTQKLTRYSVGAITLQDAVTLQELHTEEQVRAHLLSKEQMQTQFGITFLR